VHSNPRSTKSWRCSPPVRFRSFTHRERSLSCV
jgi:hypothetical protein